MLDGGMRQAIVEAARVSPSLQPTLPVRWQFEDQTIRIYADLRQLPSRSEQAMQTMGVACGSALEGTMLSLSLRGFGWRRLRDHWHSDHPSEQPDLKLAASIEVIRDDYADPLAQYLGHRLIWSGKMRPAADILVTNLQAGMTQLPSATIVTSKTSIGQIAQLHATLHTQYLKRAGARAVDSKQDVWRLLGGERGLTRSASAILFVSAPKGSSPIDMGRTFHRSWLEVTRARLFAWPMQALVEDRVAAANLVREYPVPDNHEMVHVFRIGDAKSPKPELTPKFTARGLVLHP